MLLAFSGNGIAFSGDRFTGRPLASLMLTEESTEISILWAYAPNCMTQGQDRCSKPIFFTELTKKKKNGRESKRSCSRDRGTGFLSSASFSNWSWLRPGKMSGAHRTREITPFLLSSAITQAKAFSKEVQPTRRYLSL